MNQYIFEKLIRLVVFEGFLKGFKFTCVRLMFNLFFCVNVRVL